MRCDIRLPIAAGNVTKKTGQWNHMTILARGSLIEVVTNGRQIINMDLDNWTEPHKNPDGTRNKFNTAYKDMPRIGHIGFQDHGNPVWFCNIKIKPLPELAPKICLIDENFSCWHEKGDWQTAGEALMSPVDEKLIATQPGTGRYRKRANGQNRTSCQQR